MFSFSTILHVPTTVYFDRRIICFKLSSSRAINTTRYASSFVTFDTPYRWRCVSCCVTIASASSKLIYFLELAESLLSLLLCVCSGCTRSNELILDGSNCAPSVTLLLPSLILLLLTLLVLLSFLMILFWLLLFYIGRGVTVGESSLLDSVNTLYACKTSNALFLHYKFTSTALTAFLSCLLYDFCYIGISTYRCYTLLRFWGWTSVDETPHPIWWNKCVFTSY